MISAEQQKRVDALCKQIAAEKDYGKIAKLAHELNELLAIKYPPTIRSND